MNSERKIPFYAKATLILIGLLALFTILFIAQSIIIPLVFATIVAILLYPIVHFLVKRKVNRVIAITITLLLTFVLMASLGLFLYSQAAKFSESWPLLVERFTAILNDTVSGISVYFDIKPERIYLWIAKTKNELINSSGISIGHTLVSLGGDLLLLILIPVYTFMILLYEPILLAFVRGVFGINHEPKVISIITQTKTIIQRYLIGLLIETTIVASLYTIALLALGIEYAIILAVIGALLNLIPYIGVTIGVALPMMVALATKSSPWFALYVLICYYVIQLIDNNYFVPKIVASKVKINALFSIIAVIVGNALWGIPGMFLSIPLLAIVKLILDHVEPLRPWGLLLGDTMPTKIMKKEELIIKKEDLIINTE